MDKNEYIQIMNSTPWENRLQELRKLVNIRNWEGFRDMGNVDHVQEILNELQKDQPKVISIDTETTGLDVNKDRPFQLIIGWINNKGLANEEFKGWVLNYMSLEVPETPGKFDKNRPYSQQEIVNTKALLDYTLNFNLVGHNLKYDIAMLQRVYPEYWPEKIMDTIMMAKHIDKDIEDKPSIALKMLVDSYYIRSTLPELEQSKKLYKSCKTLEEKANLIELAVVNGEFPVSNELLSELAKLRNGENTEYFRYLLNKPEKLVKIHRERQTETINEKFKEMFPEWEMTLKETYDYMTDAYSTDELFYDCRKVLKKFNVEYLGFKNEWSPIFKTGTQYNFPDYLKILSDDAAVLLIYAKMDVKITLDLYYHLLEMAKTTNFNEGQQKVLGRDAAAIKPVLSQEKTGLYLDTEYVLESIDKAKNTLRTINNNILSRLSYIANGENWREAIGLEEGVDLKANNYQKYVKFFETYTPWFPLPLHENTKTTVMVDTVTKLVSLYEKLKGNDEELKEALIKNNKRVTEFDSIVGGENIENPLIKNVALLMLQEGSKIVNTRVQEYNKMVADYNAGIEGAKKPPKNMFRKKEREIKEVIDNYKNLSLVEILNALKTHLGTVANKFIKEQGIIIFQVSRTINKTNINEILKMDLNEFKEEQIAKGKNITEKELSTALEIISIVKDKATEASLLKWIGVYMIKLLGQWSISADDRIRTSFQIAGPVTGRLSGDIQQFPKKPLIDKMTDEVIYHPRKAFKVIPTEDIKEPVLYAFLDFSQIELRVVAEYTRRYGIPDVEFIRAYEPQDCFNKELGKFDVKKHKGIWKQHDWYLDETYTTKWEPIDMHSVPVNKAFPELANIDIGENSTDVPELIERKTGYRGLAKGVGFGRVYGSSLNGILENPLLADFDKEALTAIYNGWSASYPMLVAWMKKINKEVAAKGYAQNLSGRVYRQGFKLEKNQWGKEQYSNSYKAVNYMVQGEAAQVLKVAMIRLQKYIDENNLKTKILTNIHDECGFVVPISEVDHIVKFQDIMQNMEWLDIDLVSDMEVAFTDWSEKIGVSSTERIYEEIEKHKDILEQQKQFIK